MPALPILKFRPALLPKPWGGDALWRVLAKGSPEDRGMGESWEVSDRPEAASIVADGPLAGTTLRALMERQGADVVGGAASVFPLLHKFICAREKLSVQVHPGAGSTLGEPKTECWVVVDAEPKAELIVGVAPAGKSRAEVLDILKSSRCGEVLRRWPAQKGDVFFIPAGTVHAITEGLLLYEVQQNSDTTFRLYDWGRTDAQGRPRPLHVAEAAQVADLEERSGYRISPLRVERSTHSEDYLVSCPYFALVKWHGFRGSARLETKGRFQVLTVLSGTCSVREVAGAELRLSWGETVLVPACLDAVRISDASPDAGIVVSFIPRPSEIAAILSVAGHGADAAASLSAPLYFQR